MNFNKIAVSAGHSAQEPGAVANGYQEQHVARLITAEMLSQLRARGVNAIEISGSGKTPFVESTNNANRSGAQIAIENHLNAGGGTGVEVFHDDKTSQENIHRAAAVSAAIASAYGWRNRGAKPDTAAAVGSLKFLSATTMPALLIEWGFIDNAGDVSTLLVDIPKGVKAVVDVLLGASASTPQPSAPAPTPPQAPSTGYNVQSASGRFIVTATALNVRTSPTSKSDKVRELKQGQVINATHVVNNGESVNGNTTWYEADNYGWVSAAYVKVYSAVQPSVPNVAPPVSGQTLPSSGTFKFAKTTNIRTAPNLGGSVVGTYGAGQTVNYQGKSIADGYTWLHYTGASGNKRYVAVL